MAVTVGIARSTLKKVDIDIKDYGTFIPAALGNSKLVTYLENTKSSAYQEIRDLEGQMEHVNRELEENNSVVAENEKFFDSVIKDNKEYIKILRTALSVPKKDSQNYWFTINCSLLSITVPDFDERVHNKITKALNVIDILNGEEDDDEDYEEDDDEYTEEEEPQSSAAESSVPSRRYCHNCGSPISAGEKFCSSCGSSLLVSNR